MKLSGADKTGRKQTQQVARYADMLAAMGTEPRLRIMQLLLTAHPDGLVAGFDVYTGGLVVDHVRILVCR